MHCRVPSQSVHLVVPTSAKRAEIVPILKKSNGSKTVDNIRPISLQSSLYKILSKVLASRLGSIFAFHPILHPAQDGFRPGGDPKAAISLFPDILEHAHETKGGLFAILYVFRAAYDSVRHDDLIAACVRLRLPPAFVAFVSDSLTGLRSCVRTAYGNTADFDVLRSIKQGDPLASLLFIIFLRSYQSLNQSLFHLL